MFWMIIKEYLLSAALPNTYLLPLPLPWTKSVESMPVNLCHVIRWWINQMMPYTNNIRTHWGSVAESGSSQEQLGEWCGSVILSSACLRVAATHGWKATLDWTERNTAVVLVRFRLGLSPWCGGSEEQPSRATVIGLSLYVCGVWGRSKEETRENRICRWMQTQPRQWDCPASWNPPTFSVTPTDSTGRKLTPKLEAHCWAG